MSRWIWGRGSRCHGVSGWFLGLATERIGATFEFGSGRAVNGNKSLMREELRGNLGEYGIRFGKGFFFLAVTATLVLFIISKMW